MGLANRALVIGAETQLLAHPLTGSISTCDNALRRRRGAAVVLEAEWSTGTTTIIGLLAAYTGRRRPPWKDKLCVDVDHPDHSHRILEGKEVFKLRGPQSAR